MLLHTDLRCNMLYVTLRLRCNQARANHARLGDGSSAIFGIHGVTSRTTEAVGVLWEEDRHLVLAAVR